MSSASSSDDDDDDVEDDADPVRDLVASKCVHCSCCSIMRTRAERSRAWEALHCMREWLRRCMRINDATAREPVGEPVGESVGGGVEGRMGQDEFLPRVCWPNWAVRSAMGHGGAATRPSGRCRSFLAWDVGDVVMAARSASWTRLAGVGTASKEKSRNREAGDGMATKARSKAA